MPRLTAIRKQALDELMKEALYEATVAVLSEHGVDGMTMDRVASEASVAKGSLYRYFRSKRELLQFVFKKLVDPVFKYLEDTVAQELPAIEKLAGWLRMLLGHVADHAHVHRLLFEDDATHGLLRSSERRTSEAASQLLAEIIRQGIAEGVFRPNDPRMLANMYLGLCKGVLQGEPELEEPDQRDNMHGLIMDTFLDGITMEKTQRGRRPQPTEGQDGPGDPSQDMRAP